MRDLLIKTDCRPRTNLPTTLVAPKGSRPGNFNDAAIQNRLIKNIPNDVTDAAVCKLFESTADLTWLDGAGRLAFDFSELGGGKIIRNAAATLGHLGGRSKSPKKQEASRVNGAKGGRPPRVALDK